MPFPFVVPRVAVADRRRHARAAMAAIIVLLFTTEAIASGPPLSLAEALQVAVRSSPQLESQRAMVDAAREMAGRPASCPIRS